MSDAKPVEVEELRLGNMVMLPDSLLGQIYCTVDGILNRVLILKGYGEIIASAAYPIPLTEEILLKCGFRESKTGLFIHDSTEFTLLFESMNVCFINGCGSDIKYLHQLQNLVHSLTGEELNVQL